MTMPICSLSLLLFFANRRHHLYDKRIYSNASYAPIKNKIIDKT